MSALIPLLIVLAVLVVFVGLLAETPKKAASKSLADEFPYKRVDALLTPAERSYFGVLNKACQGQGVFVACKVRLADVVWVSSDAEKSQAAFNRIRSKHVDFLVCRSTDTEPLVAIELDDASHARKSRAERDEFVDACLAAAGLPLHRERAATSYSLKAVAASLEPHLHAD